MFSTAYGNSEAVADLREALDTSELVEVQGPGLPVNLDAIWCEICSMWLNGIEQHDDHRVGKKHRRHKLRRTMRLNNPLPGTMDKYGGDPPKQTAYLSETKLGQMFTNPIY